MIFVHLISITDVLQVYPCSKFKVYYLVESLIFDGSNIIWWLGNTHARIKRGKNLFLQSNEVKIKGLAN